MVRVLKNFIKKFYSIGRQFTLNYHIEKYAKNEKKFYIESLKKIVDGPNAIFYNTTEIANFRMDNGKISIGNGTHIHGKLMTYPYGGKIEIGNNCFVEADTRIWSANNIIIGNNVQISFNVTIIDSDSHEIDSDLRKHTAQKINENGFYTLTSAPNIKTAPIIIEDDVWISFNAVILKGVTIGKRSIIAAGAIVTKDVLPDTIVAGNPAKVVKHINR